MSQGLPALGVESQSQFWAPSGSFPKFFQAPWLFPFSYVALRPVVLSLRYVQPVTHGLHVPRTTKDAVSYKLINLLKMFSDFFFAIFFLFCFSDSLLGVLSMNFVGDAI